MDNNDRDTARGIAGRRNDMLSRYQIKRGVKLEDLPPKVQEGARVDTRKHTKHCLRPLADMVSRYLDDVSEAGWQEFEKAYREVIDQRFTDDSSPFDALAERARTEDVFIGCSCPTTTNPDVSHCHTVLALGFMKSQYPDLEVVLP